MLSLTLLFAVMLAGILLSMIPIMVIYFFGQWYLIEGMMMGGLKVYSFLFTIYARAAQAVPFYCCTKWSFLTLVGIA